mmetsp:Transcript_28474/g.57297  ORF Transcript_28474/g.57297 Transcript_28474/m.57297 type:complete len:567 (+) Transcript_28474:69-1769(+)
MKPPRSISTAALLLYSASCHTAASVEFKEYPYRLFRQSQTQKEARIRKRTEMMNVKKTADRGVNGDDGEVVEEEVDVSWGSTPSSSSNNSNHSNNNWKSSWSKDYQDDDCNNNNNNYQSSSKASKAKGGKSKSSKSKSSKSKTGKGSKSSKCTGSRAPSPPPAPTTEPLPVVTPDPTRRPTRRPVEPTRKPTQGPTPKVCVPLNPNPYTFEPPKNVFPIEPWTTGGDGVWAIDSTSDAYTGTYSIKSPNFDGEPTKQISNATLEICDDFEGGPLVFYARASVLPPQDVFIVYIDGVVAAQLVDVQTFEEVRLELKPGAHTVDFSYQYNIFNLDPDSPEFENIPNKILGAVWLDGISTGNIEPGPPAITDKPTFSPTEKLVTMSPTSPPTLPPSVSPTLPPSPSPTLPPSASPTTSPGPTALIFPSASPTVSSNPSTPPPTTLAPTLEPTAAPTVQPTPEPTTPPPTAAPTQATPEPTTPPPTFEPTLEPTNAPVQVTPEPTTPPPTLEPTLEPTTQPVSSRKSDTMHVPCLLVCFNQFLYIYLTYFNRHPEALQQILHWTQHSEAL